MSTLRKLKRKSRNTAKGYESIPWVSLPGVRKMSEVLLDFAEPLLEEAGDGDFKVAISIAAACWNAAFLPTKEVDVELNELVRAVVKGDAFARRETFELMHQLIARKKALFGNDNRIIANYEVVEEEDGHRLLVASAPVNDGKR